MKIAFDAKRAFCNNSGLGNYSRSLINVVSKIAEVDKVILYTPKNIQRKDFTLNTNIEVKSPKGLFKILSSFWRRYKISSLLKKDKPEIYHGLSHELPIGIENTGVKSVVTIHDLIFYHYPNFYGKIDSSIHIKKVKHSLKVSDAVIAISEQTKQDLIKHFNVEEEKISVIRQGCSDVFKQNIDENKARQLTARFALPERFIVYCSTIESRKNHLTLLKAIKNTKNVKVVLIGRHRDNYSKKVFNFVIREKLESRIKFITDATILEIAAVYKLSDFSVYLSLCEGFGLPILESISMGKVVVATQGGCFEEAGGKCCRYIEPLNEKQISEAISDFWNNPDKKLQYSKHFQTHLSKFSDDNYGDKLKTLYTSLLNR